MTRKTRTRRALLNSVISLMLCFVMLLGTTFAWFTDTVTSSNNIIKSGTLDIEMYWADGTEAVPTEAEGWNDASTGAIFNYDKWEPGYTEVRHIKIENKGNLALKYMVKIAANGEVSNLSDVIDVYYMDPAAQIANRAELTDANKLGTLTQVLTNLGQTGNGTLVAGASDSITIAFKMQEAAGNEYMNKAIGTDFAVQLLATQLTYEEDSFDNTYDENAVYPVVNINEFQEALNNAEDGDIIQFVSDFAGDVTFAQKEDVKVMIDGNNQKFTGTILVDGKSATYTGAGVTIKNVKFTADNNSGITADACIQLGNGTNATRYTCNVTIEDCTFDIPDKVGVKSYTGGDKNLTIRNCTATANAHSLAQLKGIDGVLIEYCTVNSVRGVNFNNSNNVNVIDSAFDVKKYAVRFGESENTTEETFAITNCTLKSANEDGDAAIVLRAGATNANLTLSNTTINATVEMSGHENANITIE